MRHLGWKRPVVGAVAGLSLFAGIEPSEASTVLICRDPTGTGRVEIDDSKVVFHGTESTDTFVNNRAHPNSQSGAACTEYVRASASQFEWGVRCTNETRDLFSPAIRYRVDRYTGYLAEIVPTAAGLSEDGHAQCEKSSGAPRM